MRFSSTERILRGSLTRTTHMKPNMGTIDRAIRTAVAVLILMLYVGGYISGTVAIVLGVVAVAFVLTSAIGWCPVYVPLGLSTRRR